MKRSPSRKSALAFAAAMLAAACLLFLFDLRTYPVQPDLSNLTACMADRYRQGFHFDPSYEPNIELYDTLTLGRETLVLFDVEGSLGRAVLEENMLGWYKIQAFGYGGGSFRYGSRESDGTQYLVFGGRNPLQEIAGADFRIDGRVYHLDIPPAPFLVCTPVHDSGWDGTVDLGQLTLYDSQGADITDRYDLSGGGI